MGISKLMMIMNIDVVVRILIDAANSMSTFLILYTKRNCTEFQKAISIVSIDLGIELVSTL